MTTKTIKIRIFFETWSQRFNATDMSTIYPYATLNTIPAALVCRARGGEPRPRAGRNTLGHRTAVRSDTKHDSTRGEPQQWRERVSGVLGRETCYGTCILPQKRKESADA